MLIKTFQHYTQDKRFRFLISGGSAFLINMLIMFAFFQLEWAHASLFNKNISNVIVTELSMLCAFVIHNHFTWRQAASHQFAHSFLKRCVHFHLTSIFGLLIRFSSWALLVYWDTHVYVATVISVLLAALINYFCYDRLVFKATPHE